jgi:acyl-coenzyme A thioesterase PaaI-like protein
MKYIDENPRVVNVMTSAAEQIPEGYARHFRTSPLTDPWEPLYSKAVGGAIVIALRARSAHCNSRGFVHGGLISALADNAMGLSVIETLRQRGTERAKGGLTVNLALDFLGSGQIGQWLEFVPRVLKAGTSIGFVDCLVRADDQTIARANATFRIYQAADEQ